MKPTVADLKSKYNEASSFSNQARKEYQNDKKNLDEIVKMQRTALVIYNKAKALHEEAKYNRRGIRRQLPRRYR